MTHCPPALFKLPQNWAASSVEPNGPTKVRIPLSSRSARLMTGGRDPSAVHPFGGSERINQLLTKAADQWLPAVWPRRPDFVRDDCLLWGVSKVCQFAAVELDIARESLR
jgi:hypothetical protein